MFCPSILLSVGLTTFDHNYSSSSSHHSNGNTCKSQLSKIVEISSHLFFAKSCDGNAAGEPLTSLSAEEQEGRGKTQHETLIPLPVTHVTIWSRLLPLAAYVHSYVRRRLCQGPLERRSEERAAQFPGTSSLAADCSS